VGRDGWSVEQGQEKGRPLPDWMTEEVDRSEIAEWMLAAFFHLSTCRSYGMGYGPIPWTAIRDFAVDRQLDEEAWRLFEYWIRQMDAAYLDWHAAEEKSRRDAAAAERGRK